jgi:hypothetical protein
MPISVDLEYKLCPTKEPQRTQRGSFNNPLRLYGKKIPISVDLEYKLCPTTEPQRTQRDSFNNPLSLCGKKCPLVWIWNISYVQPHSLREHRETVSITLCAFMVKKCPLVWIWNISYVQLQSLREHRETVSITLCASAEKIPISVDREHKLCPTT